MAGQTTGSSQGGRGRRVGAGGRRGWEDASFICRERGRVSSRYGSEISRGGVAGDDPDPASPIRLRSDLRASAPRQCPARRRLLQPPSAFCLRIRWICSHRRYPASRLRRDFPLRRAAGPRCVDIVGPSPQNPDADRRRCAPPLASNAVSGGPQPRRIRAARQGQQTRLRGGNHAHRARAPSAAFASATGRSTWDVSSGPLKFSHWMAQVPRCAPKSRLLELQSFRPIKAICAQASVTEQGLLTTPSLAHRRPATCPSSHSSPCTAYAHASPVRAFLAFSVNEMLHMYSLPGILGIIGLSSAVGDGGKLLRTIRVSLVKLDKRKHVPEIHPAYRSEGPQIHYQETKRKELDR